MISIAEMLKGFNIGATGSRMLFAGNDTWMVPIKIINDEPRLLVDTELNNVVISGTVIVSDVKTYQQSGNAYLQSGNVYIQSGTSYIASGLISLVDRSGGEIFFTGSPNYALPVDVSISDIVSAYVPSGNIYVQSGNVYIASGNITKTTIGADTGSAYSIVGGAEATIVSKIIATGTTYNLYGYHATGTADARFRLYWNGSTVNTARIVWTERNANVMHDPVPFTSAATAGSLVLAVLHGESTSQSYDATVFGI